MAVIQTSRVFSWGALLGMLVYLVWDAITSGHGPLGPFAFVLAANSFGVLACVEYLVAQHKENLARFQDEGRHEYKRRVEG